MVKILLAITAVIVAGGILYLLMIMPALRKKEDCVKMRQWFFAHRGLHDNESEAPENSMAAFRRAVEAGYGIELDIQLTKDKVPVVFHDFTLLRVCGAEGRVCDYTYEELQEYELFSSEQKIPGFSEVLALVDGRVPLIVEYKSENADMELCAVADAMLAEYRGLYAIESFNPMVVNWYRKHRKGVVRGQLADAFMCTENYRGILYFVIENLLLNFWTKPDFIAYNCQYPHKLSRKICRSIYGNTAVAWTVRNEAQFEEAQKHFDIYIFDSCRMP